MVILHKQHPSATDFLVLMTYLVFALKKISHWGAVVPPSENLQMQTPPATGFLILMAYLDVVLIVPAGRCARLSLCVPNTSGILNSTAK